MRSSSPERAGGLLIERFRHPPEPINRKVHDAGTELTPGKALGVARTASHCWRNRSGGMMAPQMAD